MQVSRRGFLGGSAALAAGTALAGPSGLLPGAQAAGPDLSAPLQALAARSGRRFGSAVKTQDLLADPGYAALLAEQCSIVTPEHELKWNVLQPFKGEFDFTQADQVVSWATQRGMAVRGNTLCSGIYNPAWFTAPFLTPSNALSVLEAHISTVMTRYRGRVTSWDVVNEATSGAGYYPSIWLQLLGPRYIDNAFTIAHRADPGAQLVLNEYNLEYTNGYSRQRQAFVLQVLRGLLSRGIPVHALGIEAHLEWSAVRNQFDPAQHRSFLRQVAAMGLRVVITELDVNDINLPADPAYRDQQVAATYRRYLDTVLSEDYVDHVVTWQLTDDQSWINNSGQARFNRKDGQAQRPLPYHRDPTVAALSGSANPLQIPTAKPARTEVARALAGARRRTDRVHR